MRQSKQDFQPFSKTTTTTTYYIVFTVEFSLSSSPSIPPSHYSIDVRNADLAALCQDPRTLILYPGPKSQDLEELVQNQEVGTVKHNVIIIDGTWSQAKNIFLKNSLFHLPKQVSIGM